MEYVFAHHTLNQPFTLPYDFEKVFGHALLFIGVGLLAVGLMLLNGFIGWLVDWIRETV